MYAKYLKLNIIEVPVDLKSNVDFEKYIIDSCVLKFGDNEVDTLENFFIEEK